jgi:hypothetical protein
MERNTTPAVNHNHNAADDPVTAEPYRWADCTVHLNLTLLPQEAGEAHERVALVGVRTHADAPLIRRLPAYQVLPLPPALMQLLEELQAQLPARAAQYEERQTRAAVIVTPATNATQLPGKRGKTGRSLAAVTSQAGEPVDWSDDMFSAPPVVSEPDGTAAPAGDLPAATPEESDTLWDSDDFTAPPAQLPLL